MAEHTRDEQKSPTEGGTKYNYYTSALLLDILSPLLFAKQKFRISVPSTSVTVALYSLSCTNNDLVLRSSLRNTCDQDSVWVSHEWPEVKGGCVKPKQGNGALMAHACITTGSGNSTVTNTDKETSEAAMPSTINRDATVDPHSQSADVQKQGGNTGLDPSFSPNADSSNEDKAPQGGWGWAVWLPSSAVLQQAAAGALRDVQELKKSFQQVLEHLPSEITFFWLLCPFCKS